MVVKNNHIGETVGIYQIVEVMPYKATDKHILYKGICIECGTERIAAHSDLKRVTKCTHLRLGGIKTSKVIHWDYPRIGSIFRGMKRRCYDELDADYKTYGGKGIKIYDEWLSNPKSFEEWALNNGYADNLTIDRIDEYKDYCPSNCRWVTLEDNSKYKSTTSLIEVNGEIHTGRDWARQLDLGTNIINTYIRQYGLENTREFIKRCIINPELKTTKTKMNQSYYDLYMNNSGL